DRCSSRPSPSSLCRRRQHLSPRAPDPLRSMRAVLSLAVVALLATQPGAVRASGAAPAPDPYQPVPYVRIRHPEWTKNATIYQINLRQFTAEGTLRAAERHLPRLKALNVDIVWLMPIHEIGEKNRKGSLGSPYAVRDYYSVNHEFGTLEDLKHFVAAAHALGL